MLHLGGPAMLFFYCVPQPHCVTRVQCGAGSFLNGHLLVPCPARAPQASARCHPLPRLWDDSMSILMHALCRLRHSCGRAKACHRGLPSLMPPFSLLSLCNGWTGAWRLAWLLPGCSSKRKTQRACADLQAKDKGKEEESSCQALESSSSQDCVHRA